MTGLLRTDGLETTSATTESVHHITTDDLLESYADLSMIC